MSRAREDDQHSAQRELHAHLLDAMHAMAQPLTLLQSRLFLASSHEPCEDAALQAASEGESCREVLAGALSDVEHLCELFRLMQQLLHVEGVAPKVAAILLGRLTDALADDVEAIFAGSGVVCELDLPARSLIDSSPMVAIDFMRTRQASLDMMVVAREVAKASAQPGCTLSIKTPPGWLELIVVAPGSVLPVVEGSREKTLANTLSEQARLHLALAKANTLGHRGAFAVELAPFALRMSLPIVGPAREVVEAKSHATYLSAHNS